MTPEAGVRVVVSLGLLRMVPIGWYLSDAGTQAREWLLATIIGVRAVGLALLVTRRHGGDARGAVLGREWRFLGWLAWALLAVISWPSGPDVGYAPSSGKDVALLLISLALVAIAWFLYRVLWRGGTGARLLPGLPIAVTIAYALTGLVTLGSFRGPVQNVWLTAFVLTMALVPVTIGVALRQCRTGRP